MRKAEEILKNTIDGDNLYPAFMNCHPSWLLERSTNAIKIAQKEAYNEAIAEAIDTLPSEYLFAISKIRKLIKS